MGLGGWGPFFSFVFQLLGLGYLYIHIYIFKKISC